MQKRKQRQKNVGICFVMSLDFFLTFFGFCDFFGVGEFTVASEILRLIFFVTRNFSNRFLVLEFSSLIFFWFSDFFFITLFSF